LPHIDHDAVPDLTPIYFLHIDKTAGSSVHRFLMSIFRSDAICPARFWDDLQNLDISDLRRFQVFSGHLTALLETRIGIRLRTITLLRDPLSRTISHYAQVRRDPSSPHHALAQQLSLRSFCLHPQTRPLVENFQSHCLALPTDDALRQYRQRCDDDQGPRGGTPRAWHPALKFQPPEDTLACARETMKSCVAVGITERLSDTLRVFADQLGLNWAGVTPYEGPGYDKPRHIDAETVATIRELTTLDELIYREAAAMLDAKLAVRPANALSETPTAARGGRAAAVVRAGLHSRILSPEQSYQVKAALSRSARGAPRWAREILSWIYMGYRILVDRRIGALNRLPLAVGALYLFLPFDLIPDDVPIVGYLDDGAAVVLGGVVTFILIDKAVVKQIRLAAIARLALSVPRK
jgi:uncharacterized membrane protein YkvA (DUF1232 family)